MAVRTAYEMLLRLKCTSNLFCLSCGARTLPQKRYLDSPGIRPSPRYISMARDEIGAQNRYLKLFDTVWENCVATDSRRPATKGHETVAIELSAPIEKTLHLARSKGACGAGCGLGRSLCCSMP
jgi:hypothetical protein